MIQTRPIAPGLVATVEFFETLSPSSLAQIDRIYAPNARFKDPFQAVEGVGAVHGVFAHMFDTLLEPRFVVVLALQEGSQAVLVWDFHFRYQRFQPEVPRQMRGTSHLVLDAQGHILEHRDHWDLVEEMLEHWPLIGPVLRWIKRRALAG